MGMETLKAFAAKSEELKTLARQAVAEIRSELAPYGLDLETIVKLSDTGDTNGHTEGLVATVPPPTKRPWDFTPARQAALRKAQEARRKKLRKTASRHAPHSKHRRAA